MLRWLILIALGLGCANHIPVDEGPPADSRDVLYDVFVLEVETPFAPIAKVEVESGGAGAAQGAKMMAAAPLGCLTAGPLAGFCLALAPFFPIIAAINVQDPDVSRAELEQLGKRITEYDLHARLTQLLEQRIAAEGLPLLFQGAVPAGRVLTLSVTLAPLEMEHSGYEGGSITVGLPYEFVLVEAGGKVVARQAGRRRESFDVDEWPADDAAMLTFRLGLWVEGIVDEGLGGTLLEWQPPVQLPAGYPKLVSRRTLIGVRYQEWPVVDSLTPRLAWRPLDEVLDPITLGDVSDVTYEVEITAMVQGTARWNWASRTQYERHGLAKPSHVIETPLLPCTRYYWHPRARFRYRGVLHTTSSSASYVLNTPGPGCEHPAWSVPQDAPL